jgi:ABC-type multidrug transport system ATPase subunit
VASQVSKAFRGRRVLEGAALLVHPGEAVAVVGENGAGKTTLLRICAGLVAPDAGTVDVSGPIGYCPQEPGVLDLLSADEHLALFGAAVGLSRADALRRGRALLEQFNFSDVGRVVAKSMSGGARQKLNVALALLGDPSVVLLDEPYQGFDRGSYTSFWHHVDEWRANGKAVVIVTHMLGELHRVDHVVELTAPQNRPPTRAEVPQ